MWACEHDGVEPDIMCIGKGLASGLPLAGIVARSEIMDWAPGRSRLDVRRQPRRLRRGTGDARSGRPTSLAANAAAVGQHLLDGLRALQPTQPLIEQVRGRGLMIGIDLPDHDTAEALERACFERGLLVLTCGTARSAWRRRSSSRSSRPTSRWRILADALDSLT